MQLYIVKLPIVDASWITEPFVVYYNSLSGATFKEWKLAATVRKIAATANHICSILKG